MTPYKKNIRKERVKKMLKVLKKMFPHIKSELNYTTDFEFLIAVILSAQCTDKRVNIVTKKLFKKYPNIKSFADANLKEFEQDIFSTGFYRNKAKNCIGAAQVVLERFNGKLPRTIKEMIVIPGVGRKTASVVLGNLYGITEGIAVDTHVMRISHKFNLVDSPYTAISIERDLMEVVPKEEWSNINHYMVMYGRYYSPAQAKKVVDALTDIYPPARFKLKK